MLVCLSSQRQVCSWAAGGDEKEAVDLLPGNSLDKLWATKGNWKIDQDGVVTLTPREGEKG